MDGRNHCACTLLHNRGPLFILLFVSALMRLSLACHLQSFWQRAHTDANPTGADKYMFTGPEPCELLETSEDMPEACF